MSYPDISDVLGSGLASDLCAANRTHIVSTAGLQVYNVTAQRQIYDLFNRKVVQHPGLGATRAVHEGYSVEGVRRANADQSAYPLREDNLLMYVMCTVCVPPAVFTLADSRISTYTGTST